MSTEPKETEKINNPETSKKLSKEERRRIREKRREETSLPTKMNKYLWFVLFFAGIVTFFDGWSTLAITLAMGGFGGGFELSLEQFFNPDLFTYFGLTGSPVTMGIVLSIAGVGVVAAVSFKYFVDKYGRRPLTLLTAIAFITFSVLTAFSPRGSPGLIYFLIIRICANYFLSADIVLIIMAEEAPNQLRGRLVGAVLATNAVGGFACGIIQAIGVELSIFGMKLSTWQSLFFLTSLGYFFIIPLFFFLKETKLFNSMKRYEKWRLKKGLKPKTGWTVPLKRKYIRPMTLGCILGFLGTLITSAQVTFFALYFAKEQNMGSTLVGFVSLPLMISAGLGYYLAGPLIDRWGRVTCIHRFGNITIWAGAFMAWPALFVPGDIPIPLLMTISVLGTMLSGFCAPIWATASTLIPLEMFPTHVRSTAMGWIGAISRGGTILAPFLMMYGAEKLGGLGLSYQFMFRLMGLAVATILFTTYLLAPEGKGRMLEEIAATEIHAYKAERIPKEKYNEPYYWYAMGLPVFFTSFFIYGIASGGEVDKLLVMMIFYISVSVFCLIIVAIVRKMITEQK